MIKLNFYSSTLNTNHSSVYHAWFRVGTNTTQPDQSARNIGVVLGSTMTMLLHVDSVGKSAFFLVLGTFYPRRPPRSSSMFLCHLNLTTVTSHYAWILLTLFWGPTGLELFCFCPRIVGSSPYNTCSCDNWRAVFLNPSLKPIFKKKILFLTDFSFALIYF